MVLHLQNADTPAAGIPKSRLHWIERIISLVLLAGVITPLTVSAFRAADQGGLRGLDFHSYYLAADRLAHGQPLYVAPATDLYQNPYPYSPWPALLLRVIPGNSEDAAFAAWLVLNITAVIASCILMAGVIAGSFRRFAVLCVLFLLTAFHNWPMRVEWSLGNVDCLLLLLAVIMFVSARYSRWTLFAIALAIAACLKTWMIGFAIAPLFSRQFRAATLSVLAYALLLTLGFACVGLGSFREFFTVMRRYSVQPALMALSTPGVARQFFSANVHIQPLAISPFLQYAFLALVYSGVAGAAFYLWKCGSKSPRFPAPPRPEFSGLAVLACCAMALIALPLCHLEYFILLLPVIWWFLAGGGKPFDRHHMFMAILALAAYLPLSLPTPTLTPVPDWARTGWPRLLTALPLLCAVLAALACVLEASREKKRSDTA